MRRMLFAAGLAALAGCGPPPEPRLASFTDTGVIVERFRWQDLGQATAVAQRVCYDRVVRYAGGSPISRPYFDGFQEVFDCSQRREQPR